MVRMINTTQMRAKLVADLDLIRRALDGEQLSDADTAEAKALCNGVAGLIESESFMYRLSMAIPLKLLRGEEYDLATLEAPPHAAAG